MFFRKIYYYLKKIKKRKINNQLKKEKVFGIGFHKTGTSTLGECFRMLGYNWYDYSQNKEILSEIENRNYTSLYEVADNYNAFEDDPWPWAYKLMDKRYKNCKFILTVRDTKSWIDSMVRYFKNNDSKMRIMLYGHSIPKNNEEKFIEVYEKHNKEVKEYFKNRPNDLLIVNWEKGDDWEQICNFLNIKKPKRKFPHLNKNKK